MIELQTSVKQDDTTRTRTPKPGYLNLSNIEIYVEIFLNIVSKIRLTFQNFLPLFWSGKFFRKRNIN